MRRTGFTLIEILIVVAIIGLLAAVLLPNLFAARKRPWDAAASTCANQVRTGEAAYYTDNRSYTTSLATLDPDLIPACRQTGLHVGSGVRTGEGSLTTSADGFAYSVWTDQGSKVVSVALDGTFTTN